MKNRILIVDDDEDVQSTLKSYLEQDAYEVSSAMNAAELNAYLGEHEADVILLDLGLPDCDGLVLIAKIREYTDAPVIVVTGRGGMVDTVVGLELGADDYIAKPFQLRELSARIRASLRRYKGTAQPAGANSNKSVAVAAEKTGPADTPAELVGSTHGKLTFGEWVMDGGAMQVFDGDGKSADLTAKEFELLEALVLKPKRVLSRDQLFELVRGNDYDSFNRAIDIQITRIRKKLNDNAQSPAYIKTVRGVGYMMICDVYKLRG